MEKGNVLSVATVRHSLSHIMAAAVLEMFPDAKLGIGPAIDNGFYYDFDLSRPLVPADLKSLEKKMRELINKNLVFESHIESVEKAIEILKKADQPLKIELVKELVSSEPTFYEMKDAATGETVFADLCAGPHISSTIEIKEIGWKLDKIAGAYWRGDEKKPMLQRIYGLAFSTKEELVKYEEMVAEAAKRDHKKIGRDLDLFSFHPQSPGCPFWHEKGMIFWNALESFGKDIRKKYGYIEIKTPILAKNTLWITSGHWDHYKDGMFTFESGNDVYGLKPMDCPFNILIYKTKPRSYRELPIRYTEIGRVHRKEQSGELNGLLRVQEITQDDSHLFVREDQIGAEIKSLIKMIKEFYSKLTLKPEFFLSTRPEDYMGEISTWDKAEADLRKVLEDEKINYVLKEKDGAFYGPKIDVDIKDALGRSWQVATIQLDFQLPGRFDCQYIADTGEQKIPVMIHAAIFGSFERMIGILLEHFGGVLPVWLAPVQAKIIPITDKHVDYAKKIEAELIDKNIRVELDDRNESIGKKIREAETQKTPFMLIIGDKEIEAGKVALRQYGEGDKGQVNVDEIIAQILK
ncbi:MAG: threonine--tRNA ligase [Candidatus Berkelbacteria bacterium]